MKAAIFLIKDKDILTELREEEYDSEPVLQELLAKYPNLLAGDQIDSENPRKWILVTREMSLADESGYERWSVDHLFLDQDGIPTIVEVKRSADTRIRREVVGQMLDYAANAIVYWPLDKIQRDLEERCRREEVNVEELITSCFGQDVDQVSFWQSVKTNLQAGRIRMVFVSDKIPSELKRIIEFLNEQMDPAQVLGIEIKQYIGEGVKSLVPRLIGQTEDALKKKSPSISKEKLDKDAFFKSLDDSGKQFYAGLFPFMERHELKIRWGYAGFSANIIIDGRAISILEGYSLLAFKQRLFLITSNLTKYVREPEMICAEYIRRITELGFFKPYGSGMKWKVNRDLSLQETDSLLDVLKFVINEARKQGLND